jgi:DNA-binding transcriptional ArsR family regulator
MANDTSINSEPTPRTVLGTEAEIRAYVHPVRMSIVSFLAEEKRTASAVAKLLGVHPANLTRHFRALEKAGLIRLVEKRDTGRNLEKYYRATARRFEVSQKNATAGDTAALGLGIVRDNISSAMANVRGDRGESVTALLLTVRMKKSGAAAFSKKLKALLDEFRASDTADGEAYTLAAALYPELAVASAGSDGSTEEKTIRL